MPKKKSESELFDIPRDMNIFNLKITISWYGKENNALKDIHPLCFQSN